MSATSLTFWYCFILICWYTCSCGVFFSSSGMWFCNSKKKKFIIKLAGKTDIPSIPRIQLLIEDAWNRGFDAQGRDQLNGKVHNTRKWIGATEVVAMFSSLRIKYALYSIGLGITSNEEMLQNRVCAIDGLTNFMNTILTKVVPDNIKTCLRFV